MEEYEPTPFCYRLMLNDGVKKPQTSSIYTLLIKCCDNKPWCVRSTRELLILSGQSLPTFKKYLKILVDDGLVVVRPVKDSPKGDDINEYFLPSMEKAFYASADTTPTDERSPSKWAFAADTFAAGRPRRWGFAIDTIAVEILEPRDVPLFVRFHGLDGRPGLLEMELQKRSSPVASSKKLR